MSTADTAPITWRTNPAGWSVAHTLSHDLYVFPPAAGAAPGYAWMVDNAAGRTIAAGDEPTLGEATRAAETAYAGRREG